MKKRSGIIILFVCLFLINFPYLLGLLNQSDNTTFSGLILNPIDGYSYYAKMEQGVDGQWLFSLPFTAEPGKPVFLFFFYLFLGHISRLFSLSIPIVYHIARNLGFIYLVYQIWRFVTRNAKFSHLSNTWIFLFLMFSSGMGWILLFAGHEPADMTVAEAYPFFSALINPHFPWGIGLVLAVINEFILNEENKLPVYLLLSAALAIIMPFGSVILCMVISGFWLLQSWVMKKALVKKVLLVCIPAVLLVGFQYYETINHPQLQIWNRQNQTPTPPIWDILLSFSPMLIFALYSVKRWKYNMQQPTYQIGLVWLVLSLLMIILPFDFQRRFMFAFAIPVTLLGLFGLDDLLGISKRVELLKKLTFLFPVLAIVLLLVISVFSVYRGSSYTYITANEQDMFTWVKDNIDEGVILGKPEIAIKVPAFADKKVYYAHPFETVDAAYKADNVENWFACQYDSDMQLGEVFTEAEINYVILDHETYSEQACFNEFKISYQNTDYLLLKVDQ